MEAAGGRDGDLLLSFPSLSPSPLKHILSTSSLLQSSPRESRSQCVPHRRRFPLASDFNYTAAGCHVQAALKTPRWWGRIAEPFHHDRHLWWRRCLCFCDEGRVCAWHNDSVTNIYFSIAFSLSSQFSSIFFTFFFSFISAPHLLSLLIPPSINLAPPSFPSSPPSAKTLHHAPSSPTSAGLRLLTLTSLRHMPSSPFHCPKEALYHRNAHIRAGSWPPKSHPNTARKAQSPSNCRRSLRCQDSHQINISSKAKSIV